MYNHFPRFADNNFPWHGYQVHAHGLYALMQL